MAFDVKHVFPLMPIKKPKIFNYESPQKDVPKVMKWLKDPLLF